jgi:hypothetical protein
VWDSPSEIIVTLGIPTKPPVSPLALWNDQGYALQLFSQPPSDRLTLGQDLDQRKISLEARSQEKPDYQAPWTYEHLLMGLDA